MTTYKISIVTVCLGQLSKAQWSLRSILGQERSDIQWVVVTPEKGAELAEWLDKKPYGDMKVTTVSGRNRYEAMRKGVELADGEYVLFLEAGNRFYSSTSLKEAIEKLRRIVAEIDRDELDVDLLSEKVKEASRLIKLCKEKLYKVDEEVRNVLEELDA